MHRLPLTLAAATAVTAVLGGLGVLHMAHTGSCSSGLYDSTLPRCPSGFALWITLFIVFFVIGGVGVLLAGVVRGAGGPTLWVFCGTLAALFAVAGQAGYCVSAATGLWLAAPFAAAAAAQALASGLRGRPAA